MIIGLDVGGTHTDAVLLSKQGLERQIKVPTDTSNLFETVLTGFNHLLEDISIGKIKLTECVLVNRGRKVSPKIKPVLKRGYGLIFGQNERKAVSISLLDRSFEDTVINDLSSTEKASCPGSDQAFVLSHSDTVESSGFVQDLTFPHHVDFQAELAAMGFSAGPGISVVPEDPVS